MTFNEKLNKLLSIINAYIINQIGSRSDGMDHLYTKDLEKILRHIKNNQKVDAIKALRTASQMVHTISIQGCGDSHNLFVQFCETNGFSITETHCLGLKEAKDVIDAICNTPELMEMVSQS